MSRATATRPAAAPGKTLRKAPVQARSQRTVEAIYEATARIVDKQGLQALTTNRIALEAGISVGTLYQYFPDKEAVLRRMIEAERDRMMAELQGILVQALEGRLAPKAALRLRMRTMINSLGLGCNLNASLVRLCWQLDNGDFVIAALREATDRLAIALAQMRAPGLRPVTPAMVFVATRAALGVIRSASLEESPLLGTPEFEDEIVRMVWGLLYDGPEGPTPTTHTGAPA